MVQLTDANALLQQAQQQSSAQGYAGNLTAPQAWQVLLQNPSARLVDVRTQAEWQTVGIPDMAPLREHQPDSQPILLLEWATPPAMQPNPQFLSVLQQHIPNQQTPVFFLCRSGGRSRAAAQLATQAGYTACYNIVGGFEGGPSADGQPAFLPGWKEQTLPWRLP